MSFVISSRKRTISLATKYLRLLKRSIFAKTNFLVSYSFKVVDSIANIFSTWVLENFESEEFNRR